MSAADGEAMPLADLLTTSEAARFLRTGASTLERWRLEGTGPDFIKLGTSIRARVVYRREDLLAWVAAQRFSATSQYPRKGREGRSR